VTRPSGRARCSVAWASAATALAASLIIPTAFASSSADELVRQARAHEAAHDDAVAVRRYMEALSIEPRNAEAWIGLAALRMKMGEAAEAERVYSAAAQASVAALHDLADWYGLDRRTPAQLAIWRRLQALAVERADSAAEREARRMVRALVILVDCADPASSPVEPDATRRALASIAKRGG
jgi:Flp pilus assembly protein TadD